MISRSFQRGQTLVLFALTMLLVALMVLITVSMGSRTKEKMELQTAADVSAYNGAVATARTFNAISIMNRVQAAHITSTLGTISLISWSTMYWKHADNAADLFTKMAAPYAFDTLINCLPPPKPLCKPCAKGFAQTMILAVLSRAHASKTKSRLKNDVKLFNGETVPRWNAAALIHTSQVELLTRLKQYVGPGGAAKEVLASANMRAASEVTADQAGAMMSEKELDEAVFDSVGPVAGADPYHIGHILMASRGHPWLRSRKEHNDWDKLFSSGSIGMRSLVTLAGGIILIDRGRGRSYYDQTWTKNPSGRPYSPMAHDGEGSSTQTLFLPASKPFKNWIKCMSPLPAYPIAIGIGLAGKSANMRAKVSADDHQTIGHTAQHAFKTFPPFIDFNGAMVGDSDNLHGQPKIITALGRNVAEREVFEPSINFAFSQGSPGTQLDIAKNARQFAVGTGIVYYHRPGHSREPPNLFAPFWRASLSRYTVDRPGAGGANRGAFDTDTQNFFNTANMPEAAQVYQELDQAGYGGFQ